MRRMKRELLTKITECWQQANQPDRFILGDGPQYFGVAFDVNIQMPYIALTPVLEGENPENLNNETLMLYFPERAAIQKFRDLLDVIEENWDKFEKQVN